MFNDQNQPSDSGQPQNNLSPINPVPVTPQSSLSGLNMEDIKPAGPKPIPPAGEVMSTPPVNLPQSEEPTVMPKLPNFSENAVAEKSVDGVTSPTPPGLEMPDLPKVNHAEDMFKDTENVPTLEEVTPGAVPPPSGPAQPLTQLPDDIASDHDSGGKKMWLIILIVVILLGVGGYYVYSKFFPGLIGNMLEDDLDGNTIINTNEQAQEESDLNSNQAIDPFEEENENTNINIECPQLTPPSPDFCEDGEIITNEDENGCQLPPECILNKSSKDSDKDGLSDDEEEQYGTDPFEPDSDGDNLFDREEVKVWHTNPLNPDSDNDGFLDGDEVDSGYNPLGPGKLLDLNFEE